MDSGERGLLRDWDVASMGMGDAESIPTAFSRDATAFVSSSMRDTRGFTVPNMLDTSVSMLAIRSVSWAICSSHGVSRSFNIMSSFSMCRW